MIALAIVFSLWGIVSHWICQQQLVLIAPLRANRTADAQMRPSASGACLSPWDFLLSRIIFLLLLPDYERTSRLCGSCSIWDAAHLVIVTVSGVFFIAHYKCIFTHLGTFLPFAVSHAGLSCLASVQEGIKVKVQGAVRSKRHTLVKTILLLLTQPLKVEPTVHQHSD